MSRYIIDLKRQKGAISPEIQGHFAEHLGRCVYEGLYVGQNSDIPNTDGIRDDVASALREMKLPVLRWPGGCFADTYHWRDGVGDPAKRKKIVNYHWGGTVEDNSFGTHEFMRLCELLGCEPYINGNLGSGTVAEMQEWVEYLTFDGVSPMAALRAENGHEAAWKVKYFGVGNENWGCGGSMRPEYYADEYRRYQTYLQNYGGNVLYKIACGACDFDYKWTEVLMERAGRFMNGLSLHYYTRPHERTWDHKGSATAFDDAEWYQTLQNTFKMEELLDRHSAIMDRYDPQKRVGLIVDEWGAWYDVEPGTNPGFLYQQNTMRDALIAGINLNLLAKRCDRVKMANIAQLINVLQAVILTDGARMLRTPTYHVFHMYKEHQGAALLDSFLEPGTAGTGEITVPALHESASLASDGTAHITLCNLDIHASHTVETTLLGGKIASIEGRVLTGAPSGHNTFETPDAVSPQAFTDFKLTAEGFAATLPPCCVVSLRVKV